MFVEPIRIRVFLENNCNKYRIDFCFFTLSKDFFNAFVLFFKEFSFYFLALLILLTIC